jgi:hypothetical protein
VHGAPLRRRPTGPVLRRIPRTRPTRRVQKKIRPGSPPSRLEDAQNSHHRARRPAPAGRVSTHLERSVLCRRDQHQRRVFGVCDALVWLAGDDGVLRKKGKGAKTE